MCRFLPAPSVRRAIDFSKHKRKGSSIFLSTPSARRATGRIDYETHRRNIFLSTPSARRATQQPERMGDRHQISIHALREEGDQKGHTERRRQAISIHALREEGDLREPPPQTAPSQFLSTPSARRATAVHGPEDLVDTISIHALREEGDSVTSASATRTADFYPRPPRGGRPSPNRGPSEANDQFLSTPSARRATWCVSPGNTSSRYFYPRPPRGGRPRLRPHLQRVVQISIHALREEGDRSNRL